MDFEWLHSRALAADAQSRLLSVTESGAHTTPCARPAIVSTDSKERSSPPVDAAAVRPPRLGGIPRGDFRSCYAPMLCQGKSDFKAINRFVEDACFAEAPGLEQAPSEGNLRQPEDAQASGYRAAVETAAIASLRRSKASLTPPFQGPIALDCDVTLLDNSQSKKEGLPLTYAPMAGYPGPEGDCLELEVCAGSQHCQNGTLPLN